MDNQYYPTGAHTAALMWSKFKRPVRHVCDPSAGKGHLFRYAKEGFVELSDEQIPWVGEVPDEEVREGRFKARLREYARRKFSDIREISAVEIDRQHHASLKELGVKVLGFDFMQVHSLATVSSIIMNPPFNEGPAHVLNAWDCLYDGELVAIINAESVRNPFSRDRQRLVELIAKHGTVEYLQEQFTDGVERRTDVEIALIHLDKVPERYLDVDVLMSGLKRGDNRMQDVDVQVCAALALPSNFIQDTCFRFEQAVDAARKASEACALSSHLANGLGLTLDEMQAKGVGNDFRQSAGSIRDAANTDFKERYDNLKKRAWGQILRSSLLTDKLSNQARRKIEASSASIYELEFTEANVHGFLVGVIDSMGDIYKDMVCDLFDTIIERSSDNVVFYKSWASNRKHRIGMRIRKSRFIIPRFTLSYSGSLSYEDERFLSDVDKVFGYLMGVSQGYDGLVHGFKANPNAGSSRISTRFFDFRFYKGAGTMHIFPRTEEVVEKLNRFVGRQRNWIPADMSQANQDFQRQYDKGEAMTAEYLQRYREGSGSYRHSSPAYKLLQAAKRGDAAEDSKELQLLEAAIDAIHEARGLHCGPALEGGSKAKAIAAAPSQDGCAQGLMLTA